MLRLQINFISQLLEIRRRSAIQRALHIASKAQRVPPHHSEPHSKPPHSSDHEPQRQGRQHKEEGLSGQAAHRQQSPSGRQSSALIRRQALPDPAAQDHPRHCQL